MQDVDEQERRMRVARLIVSRPEAVYEELKRYAALAKGDPLLRPSLMPGTANQRLEKNLFEREEPLISLGLACYGWESDVVGALYKKATAPSRTAAEAEYYKGLRIACLSNQCVSGEDFLREFPDMIIGKEETRRVLAEADWEEAEALICNPCISDNLLQALYERGEPFSQCDDERWRGLVGLSRNNSRLITEEDYPDGPDLGFFRIHDAIFKLLGIAPTTHRWLGTLHSLLNCLDPGSVARPDEIDQVLERWASVVVDRHNGKPAEGYFTSAPLREEFRCLIAALYGGAFRDNKSIILGSPRASDVALRCAYYGNAELSLKEVKDGAERDPDLFAFAALFNGHILLTPALRKLLEEEYLSVDLAERYRKRCEQLHNRYKWFDTRPAGEQLAQGTAEKIADLATQIQSTRITLVAGFVMLAVLIFFRK